MHRLLILASIVSLGHAAVDEAGPARSATQAAAVATVPPFPTEELKAADAVYERAVQAGLPDARGGTLVMGKVLVRGPAEKRPRNRRPIPVQDGIRTSTFEGLHLRLADGSWLIGLSSLMKPGPDLTITTGEGAEEVAPGNLAAKLIERSQSPAHEDYEADHISLFANEDQARLLAAKGTYVPFWEALRSAVFYRIDLGSVTILHLRRLGVPEADPLLLWSASTLNMPWPSNRLSRPITLIETHRPYEWRYDPDPDRSNATWKEQHQGLVRIAPAPSTAGYLVASWFTSFLLYPDIREGEPGDAQRAAAMAVAFMPEDRREGFRPIADQLAARVVLPLKAPADADLPTHLQSWDPDARPEPEPEIEDPVAPITSMDELDQPDPPPPGSWQPSRDDLPALFSLIDDPRPSRWIEGELPRTLGDNALRAIARVLLFDPRLLIGREPTAPWNPVERAATTESLKAWWLQLAGRSVTEGMAATIGPLPPAAVFRLIASQPEKEHAPLFSALAAAWKTTPPVGQASDIAAVLALAGKHEAFSAIIKEWPFEGALRPLLACWRERAGDPTGLDRMFAELAVPGGDSRELANVISASLDHPSLERLQRIVALAGGPVEDPRTWAVLNGIFWLQTSEKPEWKAVSTFEDQLPRQKRDPDTPEVKAAQALPLAIVAMMLSDRRPVPDGSLSFRTGKRHRILELSGLGIYREPLDQGQPTRGLPVGLRICDLAACQTQHCTWWLRPRERLGHPSINPWSSPALRDEVAADLLDVISTNAREALAAANLPDILPPPAPISGGDEAIF